MGALRLTTDGTTAAKAQYIHGASTALSAVTDLSYFTKQVTAIPDGDPSYQVQLLLDGTPGSFANLVFEPTWNQPPNVANGIWQQWDVDAGKFWSSRTFSSGACSVVNGAGGPPLYTLAQIKTNCPNAVVTGYGVNVGSNNPNYDVYVDLLNFNGAVFDFEPNAAAVVKVTPADIAPAFDPQKWLFYNDETDTIDNSLGSFVTGPGTPLRGSGSAQISVSGTQRRNLATYRFSGTPLANITVMKYAVYNPSAGNGQGPNASGYLNFNVDFTGADNFQRRLVFLPLDNAGVTPNNWKEFDTIRGGAALWRYSGATWPAGVGGGGESGDTPKSWSQVLSHTRESAFALQTRLWASESANPILRDTPRISIHSLSVPPRAQRCSILTPLPS